MNILKFIGSYLIVIIVSGLSANTYADTVLIQYPAKKVDTEVVSPLPPDWWHTNKWQEFKSTRVQVIGGSEKLVCLYGVNEFPIMRRPPEGMKCVAQRYGFRCVSSGTK